MKHKKTRGAYAHIGTYQVVDNHDNSAYAILNTDTGRTDMCVFRDLYEATVYMVCVAGGVCAMNKSITIAEMVTNMLPNKEDA